MSREYCDSVMYDKLAAELHRAIQQARFGAEHVQRLGIRFDQAGPGERYERASAWRQLRDGRVLILYPHSFGQYQLTIGPACLPVYDDTWIWHNYQGAEAAFLNWDGTGEPTGWYRNPKTGRRRDYGADGYTEYIQW